MKRRHISTYPIVLAAGWRKNHCGPVALALALADGDREDSLNVAEWARLVASELRGRKREPGALDRNGTLWGGVETACERLGIPIRVRWIFGRGYTTHLRNYNLPTVAQALRAIRPGQRALVRTTGHVGYVEADEREVRCFALRPRARVDQILILEGDDLIDADKIPNLEYYSLTEVRP